MSKATQTLGFFATPAHDCSYLPNQKAVTLFADPGFPKNKQLYTALTSIGFRRSGNHLYQPHCTDCSACVPVRIPVHTFKPKRKHLRTWKQNQDLNVIGVPAKFCSEHFEVYQRYLAARHAGGGMDNPTPDSYMEFLTASWADTYFYEFRLGQQLLAVAVVDHMVNTLSAVYTFFEPEASHRSLGRFAILFEIELAKKLNHDWLYLGYWIEQCSKMKYKDEYRPVECFINNEWIVKPS